MPGVEDARDFEDRLRSALAADEFCVAGIAYVPTRAGLLYTCIGAGRVELAGGGLVNSNSNFGLAGQERTNMAVIRRQPKHGLLHHSDRRDWTRCWHSRIPVGERACGL